MHVADKIGATLAGLEISSSRSDVLSWCSPASSATTVSQLFDNGSNDGRMASQRRWSPRLPTNDACTFVGYRKWLRVRLRLRPAGQAFIKRDQKRELGSAAESMTYVKRSLLIGCRTVSIGALGRCPARAGE
jgi:hypothetical protein